MLLAAAEPRITAAVFGLFWPTSLVEWARQITVPIEFDLQWDDEDIPLEDGLALFAAFGSAEKSLHVNAGKHMALPRFESDSAVRFFERHRSPNRSATIDRNAVEHASALARDHFDAAPASMRILS